MATVSREVDTGTTTLGLVCKDGVVLAADRRATAGTLIAHKRTKKVYRLDENLGLTTAGLVGDLQVLARYITAEVELYKLKRGITMPVAACAVTAAMKRDAVSGEGIDVALISKDGFKMFDDKEVEKRKTSMKLA